MKLGNNRASFSLKCMTATIFKNSDGMCHKVDGSNTAAHLLNSERTNIVDPDLTVEGECESLLSPIPHCKKK